jgi:hypothetical protein
MTATFGRTTPNPRMALRLPTSLPPLRLHAAPIAEDLITHKTTGEPWRVRKRLWPTGTLCYLYLRYLRIYLFFASQILSQAFASSATDCLYANFTLFDTISLCSAPVEYLC